MTATTKQLEALHRAETNLPGANDVAVLLAAEAAGITDADPRHNVLTFSAWKAKGRVVRKGQHALCKLVVYVPMKDKTGKTSTRPRSTAVFHISQTDRLASR